MKNRFAFQPRYFLFWLLFFELSRALFLGYQHGAAAELPWPTLLATMKRDKKARGELLRFIVLDDIARPTTLTGPEEQLLFAAYQEISEAR